MAEPLSLLAIGGLIFAARRCSDMDTPQKTETYMKHTPIGITPQRENTYDKGTTLMNTLSGGHNSDPGLSGHGINPQNKDTHPSFSDIGFLGYTQGEPNVNLGYRPYVSGKMNNFSGVEKNLVGPGLGVDSNVPAYGGYQQLFRVLPNNVGAYNLTTLPGRPGPAGDVTGGKPTLAGQVNYKAAPKTAFLPTRRPQVEGRAQGQGGKLTGVTARGKYEKTMRPTIRSETTWRNDGLEFNPAHSIVSNGPLSEAPTRNKGDLNDGQFGYNNQPVPGITNFFGGYEESPGSKLLATQPKGQGSSYAPQQLEKYGFRPDDRRGKKDRDGNPGRMNVRAGPLNQEGLVTAVRSDCNKYDGRVGPVNGGWSQNYVPDKYTQLNPFKGQKNPYSTQKELNIAKNQLMNNPLAHTLSA